MQEQNSTKKKSFENTKNVLLVVTAVIFLIITAAVWLSLSYSAPYNYVESCFYDNQDDFADLVSYAQTLCTENSSRVKITADNAPDNIRLFLESLQKQYAQDSPYPVFSSVDVCFDNEGDMMLYVHARKEKLRSGDGINSPDIRFYYLIYTDEDYESKLPCAKNEPFSGNWYTGSSDTYSG